MNNEGSDYQEERGKPGMKKNMMKKKRSTGFGQIEEVAAATFVVWFLELFLCGIFLFCRR
ncbi:hypothetical protein LINPERPRIM_LOCUS38009 [Linum perenne]